MTDLGRSLRPALRSLACAALFAIAAAAPAAAQPQAQAAIDPGGIDPGALDALRRMSATLGAAPSFTVRIDTERDATLPNGQTVLLTGTAAIAARRPDRLLATAGSDLGNFAVLYDGARVTVLNPVANAYAVTPMTGGLSEVVARVEDELGLEMPIRPLLAADPFALLMTPPASSGIIVGRSFIGDTPVDHFAFRNATVDWEIWLEATPFALPRRVSMIHRGEGEPRRMTITFDEWTLGATLPDAMFAFTPPQGAVEVSAGPPHAEGKRR